MRTRREFLIAGGAGLCALASPISVLGQPNKVWRIGFFYFGSRQSAMDTGRYQLFLQGMRELGYVEGKNFVVEARFADGANQRLPGLAAELVESKVDLIVATGAQVNMAAQQATRTIPIVTTVASDPVAQKLAASLARPGGNFTGLSAVSVDLVVKHVELLTTTLPRLSRIAVLLNPDNTGHPPMLKNVQAAAARTNKQVRAVPAGTAAEIERGFAAMAGIHADACIVLGDTFFLQEIRRIADLALKRRLPSIGAVPEYPEAGGLMSYGASVTAGFRRAASYVDKILKGAKPGDLPIEQPTTFELVVNSRTAKALGIAIPQELLLRADKVIE
jgi:putative ABC transport system substrate-binding protein